MMLLVRIVLYIGMAAAILAIPWSIISNILAKRYVASARKNGYESVAKYREGLFSIFISQGHINYYEKKADEKKARKNQ